MPIAYLSIGSNVGDRRLNLKNSLQEVKTIVGKITALSPVYESQSWGYDGLNFLNMAIKVETLLFPAELLIRINTIEANMGRVKIQGKYTDRPIDLDILFYDQAIINSDNLLIPHPHLQNRMFVLKPLNDIEPEFIHPVLFKSIAKLLEECPDQGWIERVGEISS